MLNVMATQKNAPQKKYIYMNDFLKQWAIIDILNNENQFPNIKKGVNAHLKIQ